MGISELFNKLRGKGSLSGLPEFEITETTLVKYNGKAAEVTIPESVLVIGENAFEGCKKLKRVELHDGVLSICDCAFDGCVNLEYVGGSKSLMVIGRSAFRKCASLSAFELPSCCTDIFSGAFEGCKSLTEIKLPEGLSTIRHAMFRGCINLKKVNIPKSVDSIGSNAFDDCRVLENIVLPEKLTELGVGTFQSCFAITEMIIPDGVEHLPKNLFQWCRDLRHVVIPESVFEFGESVFNGCLSLDNIVLGDEVEMISERMFCDCRSLSSITVTDNLKAIGAGAFQNCQSLDKFDLPDSVIKVGYNAFLRCASRKRIEDMRNQKHDDPEDASDWEREPYDMGIVITAYKGSKKNVTVPQYLDGQLVTMIGKGAFANTGVVSVELPNSIITIGSTAFMDCTSLNRINIPNRVTIIEANTFSNCTSLEEITISERLKKIGYYAFTECHSLKRFFVPKRLRLIETGAFQNCTALQEFVVAEDNAVYSTIDGALYIPDSRELFLLPPGYDKEEYIVPPIVVDVENEAIGNCKKLKRIVYHENIQHAGARNLYTCPALEEVVILGSNTKFYPYSRVTLKCALIAPKLMFNKWWSGEIEINAIYGYIKTYYCGGYDYEEDVIQQIESFISSKRDRLLLEFENKPYMLRYMIEKSLVFQSDFDRLFSFYQNNVGVIADLLDYRRRNFPDETEGGIGDYSLD